MANTYELIASSTVGSGGAASIDFTSIPSTYTDLVIKSSCRTSLAAVLDNIQLTFNGSATGYTQKIVANASGSAVSAQVTENYISYLYTNSDSATSNTFSNSEIYIPNYAGSTNKSISIDSVVENNGTTVILGLTAGLWSNSAAINRVTLTPNNGTFKQYSTAYLYGIKNS